MTLFPDRLRWTREEVRKRMTLVRHAAGPSRQFRYSLWVPARWACQPPAASGPHACRLATFTPPSSLDAGITVTLTLLARDVNPADFIENELLAGGSVIVQRRMAYGPAGWVADFLSQRTREGKRYLARTTMAKDASRLYRLDCSAAEGDYPDLANLFLATLASFRLTEPFNRTVAERICSFRYIDPCLFAFKYPASWSLVAEQLTKDVTSLRLDNDTTGKCAGRVYVVLRAAHKQTDAGVALSGLISRMASTKITSLDVQQNKNTGIEGCDVAFESVVPVAGGHDAMECRALVLPGGRVQVEIGLIGPSRSRAAEWWAINKRTYEIIRDSMSVIL